MAIALAAAWISYQFTNTYANGFHKNYFYYLLTFYGFALYGIWAQIIVRALISDHFPTEGPAGMIGHLLAVLSLPFLFISWLMLIKMGYSLVEAVQEKKAQKIHLALLAGAIVVAWAALYFISGKRPPSAGTMVYPAMGAMLLGELAYLLSFAGIIWRRSTHFRGPVRALIFRFVLLMLAGGVLRAAALPFLPAGSWYPALLLLLYFLSNFPPLFYLRKHADTIFTPVFAGFPSEEKKALLFEKYEITKREREIVNKICEGKTNRQIADELFISLQTVKDHTHRIYTKIGIHSRLKLVQLVNG